MERKVSPPPIWETDICKYISIRTLEGGEERKKVSISKRDLVVLCVHGGGNRQSRKGGEGREKEISSSSFLFFSRFPHYRAEKERGRKKKV